MKPLNLKNRKYTVYKHISPVGKVYIGITSVSVLKRWANGHGYDRCVLFSRAIKKYGWKNFIHEIIAENLTYDDACVLEIKLIRYYKDLGISYNSADGGQSNKGYTATNKQREHARNIWKGKKIPRHIVEASIKSRTGLKQTKDAKLKKSIALQKHYAKKVFKVNKLGNLVKVYSCLQEAAEDNNATRAQIAQCCRGGALVFRSYHYLYEDEYSVWGISKRRVTTNRPIIVYKDGIEIGKFNDAHEAAEVLNLNASSIKDACLRKKTLKKMVFMYLY